MRRLLIATLLAFLASASAAEAAQVFYQTSSDKLRIEELSSEVNSITVSQSGQVVTIADADAPLTVHFQSASICPVQPSGAVVCTLPTSAKAVNVDLGARDDSATATTTMEADLEGGAGADTLTGGDGADALVGDGDALAPLTGDEGNDVLIGNGGHDSFLAGPGDDVVKAEDGRNESVTCGAGADSGNADAGDTLAECEAVVQPAPPAAATPEQPKTGDNGNHFGHDKRDGVPPGPKVAVPVPGKSVAVAVRKGVIMVRRPGSGKAVPLDPAQPVPVGSVLDATKGTLTLTAAKGGARAAQAGAAATQTADFTGASFVVGQKAGAPGTELRMVGGDFSVCKAASGSRTTARAAANRKRVRRLWGSGHGRFTTRGRNSSATVRGTIWIVEDRCDGTLTRVTRGVVVVTDHVRNRTKVVRAGQSYLVRNAPARRRR